ncbi:MAG: hypothetical protein V3U30_05060 [Thermoplasmata archaeon]
MLAGAKGQWRSIAEKAAFIRLREIAEAVRTLRLPDTYEAFDVLLRRRRERGTWNWGVLEDATATFELELSEKDPTFENSLRILKEVFDKTLEVKRRKGKRMDAFEVPWTQEDRILQEASLKVLTRKLQEAGEKGDAETAILLAALGHIIRYETKGEFVRRRIHAWAQPSVPDRKKREGIVEGFMTIRRQGTDGLSDVRHIRNAFAHAHFEIIAKREVQLWDERDGRDTFVAKLTVAELLHLFNLYETKLAIAEIYPSLVVAMEDLFGDFKDEWRRFIR